MKQRQLSLLTTAVLTLVLVGPLPLQAAMNPDRKAILYHSVFYDPNATTCSSPGSPINGANNPAKAYNFFVAKGLTAEQAAGIVGNLIHESIGVEPQRLQGTSTLTPADNIPANDFNDRNTGWGIAQWSPPSKAVTPMKQQGKVPNMLSSQLDFLWGQLTTNEKAALDAVKATNTPETAAQAFSIKYERSNDAPGSAAAVSRSIYARAMYEFATKNTPFPSNVPVATSDTTASAPAAATDPNAASSSTCPGGAGVGGYKDPFRDLKNSHVMRMDGGVDYGGNGNGYGPVHPVGNAKIIGVRTSGSGWPGLGTPNSGAYIWYQLTDGPANGKYIYIAEDCTPTVKVGDIVNINSTICNYKDQPWSKMITGTHLETGWASPTEGYVSWSDYPGAPNAFASNSGQDMSRFLQKLGVAPALLDKADGGTLSQKPPPADWPKW